MMGEGGAYLILIMLFMAVTSTGSAERDRRLFALMLTDVYKTYINWATGAQLMWVGRCVDRCELEFS
jgi:Na+/proline symporter